MLTDLVAIVTTALAFVVAILVLVTVHEWGHFSVARLCGVKVFRFSVGFGPRLWGWTSASSGTEFVIAAIPLGGYVKMLDERDGPVEPHERNMALNQQPLYKKAAVVLAGPVANLLLAIALYSSVNWMGVEQAQAIVASPPPGSVLANAHLVGGERVLRVGFDGDALVDVASFDDFRWWLARGAIAHHNVQVEYAAVPSGDVKTTVLALDAVDASKADAKLFEAIGAVAPFSQARIADMEPGEAAEQAHLKAGDVVLRVDATDIFDAAQLRALIRATTSSGAPVAQSWLVQRDGARISVVVEPKPFSEKIGFLRQLVTAIVAYFGKTGVLAPAAPPFGRVGAVIAAPPAMTTVHYGTLDGVTHALTRTWETSALSLRVLGQIVTLRASVENLSGPATIAVYAGKSAAVGLTQYLLFLALMSVSLGVLNLLPLPVLDGGHLMYYLWEALSGKPVSQAWTEQLQKLGLVILLMMMSVALFNDAKRLLW